MKKQKTKQRAAEKNVGAKLKERSELKKQIADRVKPGPKPNPNAQKRKFASKYGEARKAAGVTLTAIMRSINERGAHVVVAIDDNGDPTGETVTNIVKPSAKLKALRRETFVARGLLAPYPSANERRKVRRRNNRYAAVGGEVMPPKKMWHRVKKGA